MEPTASRTSLRMIAEQADTSVCLPEVVTTWHAEGTLEDLKSERSRYTTLLYHSRVHTNAC
jgi:hypothetical protein